MKNCEIIGYGEYTDKETKELKLRIVYGIKAEDEKYTGTKVGVCFLDSNEILKENLKDSINNRIQVKYETTDDVITGKTKIKKFIFD